MNDFVGIDKSELNPIFIDTVNDTIKELHLSIDDFCKVINFDKSSKCRFCAMIVRRFDNNCSDDKHSGDMKLADWIAKLYLSDLSDDDIVFNIVCHAFNGMLRSILADFSIIRRYFSKEDIQYLDEVHTKLRDMATNQFYYHNLTKHFSICDIHTDRQYPYITLGVEYWIKDLFKLNLCLWLREYVVVFYRSDNEYIYKKYYCTKEQEKEELELVREAMNNMFKH